MKLSNWAYNSHSFKLLILIFLAFIVKGWNIGETDIGIDECFSVYNAQLSVSEISRWLLKGNNPPLWEIILHYWVSIFGVEEISIRILSLIFNVSTLIPIYLIGEHYFNKNVGFYTAILFIFSSFSLFMAHEARVYSLLGMLATWSVYFYLKILDENKTKYSLLILSLINGLILYSHYLGYWVIITQVVLFLILPFLRREIGKIYWFHVLVMFMMFIPLINVFITRLTDSGLNGTWVRKSSGIESLYFILVDFFNKPVVAVIFLLILFASLIRSLILKKFEQNSLILGLFIWIPILISFILSFKVGLLLNRYFYFVLPLLYLSVVNALFSFNLRNPLIKKVLLLIPFIGIVLSFEVSTKKMIHSGKHQQIKEVIEFIQENNKKDNLIYFAPVWLDKKIVYYLNRSLFISYFEEYDSEIVFKNKLNEINIYPIYSKAELINHNNFKKVIFIDNKSEVFMPRNLILNQLSKQLTLTKTKQINEIQIYTFEN